MVAERGVAAERLRTVRPAISEIGSESRGSTRDGGACESEGGPGVSSGRPEASSLAQLLRNGTLTIDALLLRGDLADLTRETVESAAIEVRYEGYIQRQVREVERTARHEHLMLADSLWEEPLLELSKEGREKLRKIRPSTVAQAARVPGVSPADATVLVIYAERERRRANLVAAPP
jgi:tRNA U34 5-carboxymethylaminomethyl modifying enzyme MnmG/GidA